MLHSLDLELDLPRWFYDLEVLPSKSVLDAWRWGFRAHGRRTLTPAHKDIVWTVSTYAQARDTEKGPVGTAWPGQELTAAQTRATVATVSRALNLAEESGWLVSQRRPNDTSKVYLSVPRVLPEVTSKRSKRAIGKPDQTSVTTENQTSVVTENQTGVADGPSCVLTENRVPVATENQACPDGEPDFRRDGDEPTYIPQPTVESTAAETVFADSQGSADAVRIRITSGQSEGQERVVSIVHGEAMVRSGLAELIGAAA